MRFRSLLIDYKAEAIQILREEEQQRQQRQESSKRREIDEHQKNNGEDTWCTKTDTVYAQHRTRRQKVIRILVDTEEDIENRNEAREDPTTPTSTPRPTTENPELPFWLSPVASSIHEVTPIINAAANSNKREDSTNDGTEGFPLENIGCKDCDMGDAQQKREAERNAPVEAEVEVDTTAFATSVTGFSTKVIVDYKIFYESPWLLALVSNMRRRANRKRIANEADPSRTLDDHDSYDKALSSNHYHHRSCCPNDYFSFLYRTIVWRAIGRFRFQIRIQKSWKAGARRLEEIVSRIDPSRSSSSSSKGRIAAVAGSFSLSSMLPRRDGSVTSPLSSSSQLPSPLSSPLPSPLPSPSGCTCTTLAVYRGTADGDSQIGDDNYHDRNQQQLVVAMNDDTSLGFSRKLSETAVLKAAVLFVYAYQKKEQQHQQQQHQQSQQSIGHQLSQEDERDGYFSLESIYGLTGFPSVRVGGTFSNHGNTKKDEHKNQPPIFQQEHVSTNSSDHHHRHHYERQQQNQHQQIQHHPPAFGLVDDSTENSKHYHEQQQQHNQQQQQTSTFGHERDAADSSEYHPKKEQHPDRQQHQPHSKLDDQGVMLESSNRRSKIFVGRNEKKRPPTPSQQEEDDLLARAPKRQREMEQSNSNNNFFQDITAMNDHEILDDMDNLKNNLCDLVNSTQKQLPNQNPKERQLEQHERKEFLLLQRFGLLSTTTNRNHAELSTATPISSHGMHDDDDRTPQLHEDVLPVGIPFELQDTPEEESRHCGGDRGGNENISSNELHPEETDSKESTPVNNVGYSSPEEFPVCLDYHEEDDEIDDEMDGNSSSLNAAKTESYVISNCLPEKTDSKEPVPANNVDYSSPAEFPICLDYYEEDDEIDEIDENIHGNRSSNCVPEKTDPKEAVLVNNVDYTSPAEFPTCLDYYEEEEIEIKEVADDNSSCPFVAKVDPCTLTTMNDSYHAMRPSNKKKIGQKKKRRRTSEEKKLRKEKKRRRKEIKKKRANQQAKLKKNACANGDDVEKDDGDQLETPRKLDMRDYSSPKASGDESVSDGQLRTHRKLDMKDFSSLKASGDENAADGQLETPMKLDKRDFSSRKASGDEDTADGQLETPRKLDMRDFSSCKASGDKSASDGQLETPRKLDMRDFPSRKASGDESASDVFIHRSNQIKNTCNNPIAARRIPANSHDLHGELSESLLCKSKSPDSYTIEDGIVLDDPFSVTVEEILQATDIASEDPFSVSPEEILQATACPDAAAHGHHQAPIRLLCSENFLEHFGEVIAEVVRGDSTAGTPIRFTDTDLVDACNVDIELPSRGAMVVSTLSEIQTSGGLMGAFLPRIVELVATNRYDRLAIFVCLDVELDSASARDLVRLQTAFFSFERGLPRTQTSVQWSSKKSLAACIAQAVFRSANSGGCVPSSSQSNMGYWLSDPRTCQRLKFLLSIIPTLSVIGALHWLDLCIEIPGSSWNPSLLSAEPVMEEEDKSLAWFQRCFRHVENESNRLESSLLRSGTNDSDSNLRLRDNMNPGVPKQLVIAVNVRFNQI